MTQTQLLELLQKNYPDGADSGMMDVFDLGNITYVTLFTQLGIYIPSIPILPTVPLKGSQGFAIQGTDIIFDGSINGDFFGVTDGPVKIQFTPDIGDDTIFIMLIHLELPDGWRFGDSILFFRGGVYDQLLLDTSSTHPALIFSSGLVTNRVNDRETPHLGLYFYGQLNLTDKQSAWPLRVTLELLNAFIPIDVIFGEIGLDLSNPEQGKIVMNLELGSGTLSNLFGINDISITLTVSLFAGLRSGIEQYQSGILLSGEIIFNGEGVILSGLLSGKKDGLLDLEATGELLNVNVYEIARYFGDGTVIFNALPPQFRDNSNIIKISAINFGVGLKTKKLEYAALIISVLDGQEWTVFSIGAEDENRAISEIPIISIGDLSFAFTIFDPFGTSPNHLFNFSGVFNLGGVLPIFVEAALGEAAGLVLSGSLLDGEEPKLVDLVTVFFPGQPPIPDDLIFEEVNFYADIASGTYSANMTIFGEWNFEFGDDNNITFQELTMSFEYDSSSDPEIQAGISAKFAIDQSHVFDIALDIADRNFTFTGTWTNTGTPITYIDLMIALGMYGLPGVPDIDLDIENAQIEFRSQNRIVKFQITLGSFGSSMIIAGKSQNDNWGFIFGLQGTPNGEPINVKLTDIPIVGNLVPSGADTLSITNMRFVGATAELPEVILSEDEMRIVGPVVSSGITLSIDFAIGALFSDTFTVRFALNDGSAYDKPPSKLLPPLPPGEGYHLILPSGELPADAPAGSLVKWINVQRTFGPVQFNRVGFEIVEGNKLGLLLDAGVSLGGLGIGLNSLKAVMPINSAFTPEFSLGGLDISYKGSKLTILGSLIMLPQETPAKYSGNLTVQAGPYTAVAFGSYSTVDGHPSFFAYLAVTAPLGGPAFFFVTGLAGGFGYNALIDLPTIDTVATYPLIQAVTQSPPQTAAQVRAALVELVEPELNQNWLAAGVKFTSFQMLDSFALLTVMFGNNFAVALMGRSLLTIPLSVKGESKQDPIAQAELLILIEFLPALGIFSVNALLSPASYVLNKDARLTGGFAFYLWFDPSPYADDFVVTLGGYNPYFVPQPYYPTVPRLGISWQLSSEMSITGSVYFALTPSVIMAGGSLNAVFNSGSLRAWFNAEADFLIRFKPFYYQINISISVGASLTLDLLFTTTTITLSIGVGLRLWGPPFGGTARIDLSIISLTIDFGSNPPSSTDKVDWIVFKESFLPLPEPAEPSGMATPVAGSPPGDVTPTITDSIIALSAVTGLIRTISEQVWQVDAETLVILVTLQIPVTASSLLITDSKGDSAKVQVNGDWTEALGVGPMGIPVGELTSTLDLTVALPHEGVEDTWAAHAVTGKVPKGLWGDNGNSMDKDGTIKNVVTGVKLIPTPKTPATTSAIDINVLLYGISATITWEWLAPEVETTDSYHQDTAMQQLETTLTDPTIAAIRSALITSLNGQGFGLTTAVDVTNFAAKANSLLLSAPVLRLLGEEKAESAHNDL